MPDPSYSPGDFTGIPLCLVPLVRGGGSSATSAYDFGGSANDGGVEGDEFEASPFDTPFVVTPFCSTRFFEPFDCGGGSTAASA